MDFTQVLRNLPFALMFFFPAWAVVFAFIVAFKRHAADDARDETDMRGTGATSHLAGLPSSGSELTRERKIELLRIFAINPVLFAPAGDVQDTARRLLEDLSGAATSTPPAQVHGTAGEEVAASAGTPQYHVATQATVALLISILAVIWHFLSR